MTKRSTHIIFAYAAGLLAAAADQATKRFAYRGAFGGFLNFLRPVFGLQIAPNYNFAFGIAAPHVLVYILYAIIFAAFTYYYFHGRRSAGERYGYALIIAGAASNILDRIMLGYVRDFIYAFWGNIFNVADIAILLGIVLFLLPSGNSVPVQE